MFKKKTFSSVPEECTPQQLETLSKLRARIRELGYPESTYDDKYLLRFLCARKFDLEKTLQMWTNFIDWRNKHNVDQIRSLEIPEMEEAKQYYPHTWFRTDKKGRPIFIECMGKLKIEKMLEVLPADRLELYFIRDFERLLHEKLPASSEAFGAPVYNTCYIMDLKGANSSFLSAKVWELLKIASKIGQDYYPETLGDMFVINAPMFVYGAWNIVKHLMDEKTRTKIHILGSNYKKELFKYVDEENLPDFLGGKVTEEEYGPHLMYEQGPWVKSSSAHLDSAEKETKHSEGASSPLLHDLNALEIKGSVEVAKEISPVSKFEIEEEFSELEIAQECPLKQAIKNLRMRPSFEFNFPPIVRCGK